MYAQPLVLIIDDELAILETLQGALQDEGYQVQTLADGSKVLDAVGKYIPDLILLDIFLPHHNGIALLESIKKEFPQQQVMMISGFGNIPMALEATSKGALDFIEKPLSLFDILPKIEFLKKKDRSKKQKTAVSNATRFGIIGQSFLFKELISHVEQLAQLPFSLLIYGAHGTGKTLFAQYIHSQSRAANAPCTIIKCNQQTVFAPETFNHSGSLVLAHIDLLSVVEQKKVADYMSATSSCRVMATSSQPLAQTTLQGTFNEQLFYKLNIVPIEIPSLEKRRFDIPLLADFFINSANKLHAKEIMFTPSGIRFLRNYCWNNNVRELKDFIYALIKQTDDLCAIIDWETLATAIGKKNSYDPYKIFATLKTDFAANG